MKRVLVTGGAGFIGSHLCEKLIQEKNRVICVDNLGSGRKANLKNIINNPYFVFIKRDIIRPFKIPGKIDFVYHLASYASPPYYQKHSIHTLMTNSLGTYNILELARQKRARFLITSTSEAYGDPLVHPQREDYWGNVNPVGIRSCYDEAKRFGEALTMEYVRKHGLSAVIIRIFNTYGPRLQKDDGRVISNFINQCLAGRPVTIYGSGNQTRSFCYVSDQVAGLMLAMKSGKTAGEVINIGNPDEFTVKEAAHIIKKLTGSKSGIVYRPLPQDDPARRRPDIRKAKKLLNWKPAVKLEEGLVKTISWFKNVR
ncbi:MAG TPA: SDR family oxidoreductase [bacterium]|nr:SDR family oxidoreductase [bacterium]